jgi:hypothetical protein
MTKLLKPILLCSAIGITFLTHNAFADEATAMGCSKLLDSRNRDTTNVLYDTRNYYKHHSLSGYYLKEEEATKDIIQYYSTIYNLEKSMRPHLQKSAFCIKELQSLLPLAVARKRDFYAGNSYIDCRNILKKACEDQSISFDNKESIDKELVLKTKMDMVFDEIIKTEKNYLSGLKTIEPSFELLMRIFSQFTNSEILIEHFTKLFDDVKKIIGPSEKLLEILKTAQQTQDPIKEAESLAHFVDYFENTKAAYQSYRKEYEDLTSKKTVESLEKKFLENLGSVLMSPIQRVPRYRMLLESLDGSFERAVSSIEAKQVVVDALEKAKDFAQFVNAD